MKREIIPYNPKLKKLAQKLRQNMTLSEVLLWDELKQKRIKGYDFDRQKPIDEYIVDFYCKDLKLAIEVDGDSHDNEESYKLDAKRQKRLETLGVQFLRFDDLEVKKNINNVIRTIEYWIEEWEERNEVPTPTPPRRGSVDLNWLLNIAKQAALDAGSEILKIYETGDFSIESKSDNSPLTIADKKAHNIIVSHLRNTGLPILSEEGRNIEFEERSSWEYFWMVDPLDGTKEFIKKNGEFTVNIALIYQGEPVLGIVYPPVIGELYFALKGEGAFRVKNGQTDRLNTTKRTIDESGLKVVASRSHMSSETEDYLSKLKEPEIVSKGSSLKFLLIASGEADVYPRFGPTMEWDTAAAHAIVTEAGGSVLLSDSSAPLSYNKKDLLNPYFIVLPT